MARTPKYQRKASWQFENWWEAKRFSKWAELVGSQWFDDTNEVASLIWQFLGKRRRALGLYHADLRYYREQAKFERAGKPIAYAYCHDAAPLHRAYSAKKKRSKRK